MTWHLKRVLIYQNNLKLWISIWSNKVPCKLLYVSKLTCIRWLNNCYLQNCDINTKPFSYYGFLTDRAASVLLNTRRDVYPITSDTGQVSLNFGNAPAFLRFYRLLQKTWFFQIISRLCFSYLQICTSPDQRAVRRPSFPLKLTNSGLTNLHLQMQDLLSTDHYSKKSCNRDNTVKTAAFQ